MKKRSQSFHRRTATKVRDGRVMRKDRHAHSGTLQLTISRVSPRPGFRHVVRKRDVRLFIDLIPDWPELSQSLEGIRLGPGCADSDGAYASYGQDRTGAIHLEAWHEDLWQWMPSDFVRDHLPILEWLGVPMEPGQGEVCCRFTEAQARGFSLLHIFLHELGHHVDRLRSRDRREPRSGEVFAEAFALERFKALREDYARSFGHPAFS